MNRSILIIFGLVSISAFGLEKTTNLNTTTFVASAVDSDFSFRAGFEDVGGLNDQWWMNRDEVAVPGCFLQTVSLTLDEFKTVDYLVPGALLKSRAYLPAEYAQGKLLTIATIFKLKNQQTYRVKHALTLNHLPPPQRDMDKVWVKNTEGWKEFTFPSIKIYDEVESAVLEVCNVRGTQFVQIANLTLTAHYSNQD
ncbi:MAG: hypothetical protein EOP04_03890 [Proteobacteria bacterium]|nr:MAG: hypothetical protein EOP04_03890 [Pseudomonadota bacterium]